MKTKIYKLRHKPTGLFYQPGERNLSEKGKTYTRIPSRQWPDYYVKLPKDSKVYKKYADKLEPLNKYAGTPMGVWEWATTATPDDWEIVTYDMEYNVSPGEVQ